MGSEALPDWALLALEKRARLLENALRHTEKKLHHQFFVDFVSVSFFLSSVEVLCM